MIERARRLPRLLLVGTTLVIGGGAADVVLHVAGRMDLAQAGHYAVFAGMVLTLAGVLLDARHARREDG